MNKEDLGIHQAMVVWAGCPTARRYDGRVAKIGRRYVTIEYWRSPGNTSFIEFDIETQKERGNTSHYAARFISYDEQDRKDREQVARDKLKEFGLVVRYDGPTDRLRLTLDKMESIVLLLERWDTMLEGCDEDEALPG